MSGQFTQFHFTQYQFTQCHYTQCHFTPCQLQFTLLFKLPDYLADYIIEWLVGLNMKLLQPNIGHFNQKIKEHWVKWSWVNCHVTVKQLVDRTNLYTDLKGHQKAFTHIRVMSLRFKLSLFGFASQLVNC